MDSDFTHELAATLKRYLFSIKLNAETVLSEIMCWDCGSLTPILDEIADLLGIERSVYWFVSGGVFIRNLIYGLREMSTDASTFPEVLEIARTCFPNMLPPLQAKEIATKIDLSQYMRNYPIIGIPDHVYEEWKRNMYDVDPNGMQVVMVENTVLQFTVYKFMDPKRRKPCKALSKFEYPDLVDLRYWRPDLEKLT